MLLRLLPLAALAALSLATAPALAQYNRPPPQTPQGAAPIPQPRANPSPTSATEQAPAAQAPATTTGTTTRPVPEPTCVAPEYPGELASNNRITAFNRDYKAYGECIKKYVEDNRAWINAVVEANNKAVEDYNKYNAELKKEIDAAAAKQ